VQGAFSGGAVKGWKIPWRKTRARG